MALASSVHISSILADSASISFPIFSISTCMRLISGSSMTLDCTSWILLTSFSIRFSISRNFCCIFWIAGAFPSSSFSTASSISLTMASMDASNSSMNSLSSISSNDAIWTSIRSSSFSPNSSILSCPRASIRSSNPSIFSSMISSNCSASASIRSTSISIDPSISSVSCSVSSSNSPSFCSSKVSNSRILSLSGTESTLGATPTVSDKIFVSVSMALGATLAATGTSGVVSFTGATVTTETLVISGAVSSVTASSSVSVISSSVDETPWNAKNMVAIAAIEKNPIKGLT